jgi:hypothetical protein
MSKYMGAYYWTRKTEDLRAMRSKKANHLERLRGYTKTYFVMQDIKKIAEQIDDIDAVLEARKLQASLF